MIKLIFRLKYSLSLEINTKLMKDEEILALLRDDKQEEAFRGLVKTYHQLIYWQVRRIVLSHEDADDVTQNVFMKVYKSIGQYKADAKLSTWLYRISYNEALNFIKKAAKEKHLSGSDYAVQAVENLAADTYFTGDEIDRKLQLAIATLPDKQRQVFLMRYYDDLPYEQISTILGASVGGLKASYHHAAKKIEEYILIYD